jgi:hypothetical protein
MLAMAKMMPQYQAVLAAHGFSLPLGRMLGQELVEVKQPATRALTTPTKFSSLSL